MANLILFNYLIIKAEFGFKNKEWLNVSEVRLISLFFVQKMSQNKQILSK